MQENILSKLLTECPFSEVFEDTEKVEGCSFPVPRRKIGHIRADYDGWRWYNTVWPCHKALATPEVCTEIDRVYNALTAPDALKDLAALRKFCTITWTLASQRSMRMSSAFTMWANAVISGSGSLPAGETTICT